LINGNYKMKYVYEFTNQRKLTKAEFLKWFQKKVLYTIRKFKMIKNTDLVVYVNKGDFRGVVLEDVLKMFSEKADVELMSVHRSPGHHPNKLLAKDFSVNNYKKYLAKRDKVKIAVTSTIDTESDKIIHSLIEGDVKDLKEVSPVNKNLVKPLYLFLDKEVLLYAKLKNLKHKKIVEKKDKISGFVNELETKHPEIKRAMINSYLELYN